MLSKNKMIGKYPRKANKTRWSKFVSPPPYQYVSAQPPRENDNAEAYDIHKHARTQHVQFCHKAQPSFYIRLRGFTIIHAMVSVRPSRNERKPCSPSS